MVNGVNSVNPDFNVVRMSSLPAFKLTYCVIFPETPNSSGSTTKIPEDLSLPVSTLSSAISEVDAYMKDASPEQEDACVKIYSWAGKGKTVGEANAVAAKDAPGDVMDALKALGGCFVCEEIWPDKDDDVRLGISGSPDTRASKSKVEGQTANSKGKGEGLMKARWVLGACALPGWLGASQYH